jgi:hypothetical protein
MEINLYLSPRSISFTFKVLTSDLNSLADFQKIKKINKLEILIILNLVC